MGGMAEERANSSRSDCEKVRKTTPRTSRPRTRAVSLIGSPRPSWISFAERKIGSPPSSRIPTSKETRVRVEDFANNKAQTWPASGWLAWHPRSRFITAVSTRICSISDCVKFSILNRCFMEKSRNEFPNSGGEFRDHRFDNFQTLLRFASPKIQRRQKAKDLGAGGNRQKSRSMQKIGESDSLGL